MHKFRKDQDFSFLENCTLTQIVIDRYQLTFGFSEMYRIICENAVEYRQPTSPQVIKYLIQPGMAPVLFHELLEQRVVAVTSDEWKFTMTFEGGGEISVLTEEGPYESGHILSPNGKHSIIF